VPQLAPIVGQGLQPVANTVAAAAVIDQRQWASGSLRQLLRGGPVKLAPNERHSAAVGVGAATTQAAPCLSEAAGVAGVAGVAAAQCIEDMRAEPEVGFGGRRTESDVGFGGRRTESEVGFGGRRTESEVGFEDSRDRRQACLERREFR
jgi:hypothetical protein